LTEEGKKKMRLIAQGLKNQGVELDLILASPFLRAAETARILAKTFGLESSRVIPSAHLAPTGRADRFMHEIQEKYADARFLAAVGHEPYLSNLASTLIAGNPSASLIFKKGGVCRLAIASIQYGRCADLEWLLPPKIFTRI
jgi:phosphohistidine phosphatase